VTATYKDAEQELEEIDGKLRKVATQRSVGQIDAAIGAVLARPVMAGERIRGTVGKLSANCSRDERVTAEACLEVAGLREERAAAEHATRLENRRIVLRAQITKLREGGGSLAADPVAELFAWLSRGQLSVRDIGFGFPLVFAFLIEIVSAFGPAGIVAYAEATRRGNESTTSGRLKPDIAGRGRLKEIDAWVDAETGSVLNWVAERGIPTSDTTAITVEELHSDYEMWCQSNGVKASPLGAFAVEFDRVRELPELGGRIRKFGTRYYGIMLGGNKVARLPARKR